MNSLALSHRSDQDGAWPSIARPASLRRVSARRRSREMRRGVAWGCKQRSMTQSLDSPKSLDAAASLRPISIDELADVRYLHELSVKRLAASHLSEREVAAFVAYLRSAEYTDRLTPIAAAGKLTGAYLDGALAGTAGWQLGAQRHRETGAVGPGRAAQGEALGRLLQVADVPLPVHPPVRRLRLA